MAEKNPIRNSLNRYLIFSDVTEITPTIMAVLTKNGYAKKDVINYFDDISNLCFSNRKVKLVNLSENVLKEYVNLLNSLLVPKITSDGVIYALETDVNRYALCKQAGAKIEAEIKKDDSCLTMPSVADSPTLKVVSDWIKLIDADEQKIQGCLKPSEATKIYEKNYLLTNYAKAKFNKLVSKKEAEIAAEFEETKQDIAFRLDEASADHAYETSKLGVTVAIDKLNLLKNDFANMQRTMAINAMNSRKKR